MSTAAKNPVAINDLADSLVPALGRERALEAVRSVLARLGVERDPLDALTAWQVLDLLAPSQGLVGAAARLARSSHVVLGASTGDAAAPESADDPSRPVADGLNLPANSSEPLRTPNGLGCSRQPPDLVSLLSPSLGRDKAAASVHDVCARLHLRPEEVERHWGSILNELSQAVGPVGVAARFVRSRLATHIA